MNSLYSSDWQPRLPRLGGQYPSLLEWKRASNLQTPFDPGLGSSGYHRDGSLGARLCGMHDSTWGRQGHLCLRADQGKKPYEWPTEKTLASTGSTEAGRGGNRIGRHSRAYVCGWLVEVAVNGVTDVSGCSVSRWLGLIDSSLSNTNITRNAASGMQLQQAPHGTRRREKEEKKKKRGRWMD